MPSKDSTNFVKAYRALQVQAEKKPEWFDIARDVLKRSDNGSVLLLHALMDGLHEAYERGRQGLPPPTLKLVEPLTKPVQRTTRTRRTEPVKHTTTRISRRR